jgi:hypothetical protein
VAARKARDLKQALTTKGFIEQSGDHWRYFFHYNGLKSSVNTKISHNATEVSTPLCSAMARQMKLTSPQFDQFVECTLTGETYASLLLQAGHVRLPEKKSGDDKDGKNDAGRQKKHKR